MADNYMVSGDPADDYQKFLKYGILKREEEDEREAEDD